jgi:hypothetical protein
MLVRAIPPFPACLRITSLVGIKLPWTLAVNGLPQALSVRRYCVHSPGSPPLKFKQKYDILQEFCFPWPPLTLLVIRKLYLFEHGVAYLGNFQPVGKTAWSHGSAACI